jgi:imidazolonepropionase-like amidohydrolase
VMYGAAMDTLEVRSDSLRVLRRTRGLNVLQFSAAMTRAAAQAGVPIVAGTDNIGRQSPTIHLELQMLVERAGLSPLAAIHAATEAGARVLGIADSIGTVRPGKVADLVILTADPTIDIANSQTVEAVMHNGVLHRRSAPMPSPLHARPAGAR